MVNHILWASLLLLPHIVAVQSTLVATPVSEDGRVFDQDMCTDMTDAMTDASTVTKMSTSLVGPEVCAEVTINATRAPKVVFTPVNATFGVFPTNASGFQ